MALIAPFRALRPAPESAARIAAVPYDVVTVEEARSRAQGNPLSFLHVSRAEIDLPAGTDPYADAVYDKAVDNFEKLKSSGPLIMEDAPTLYVYRLRRGAHEQTGVAGVYSMDEYDRDVIKKHERTRRDKEDDRTKHMLKLRAQTGPVFLTYRASALIDAIVQRTVSQPTLFDFTADDDVWHSVWRVDTADARGLVRAFGEVPALYIADGHHRAASAARARAQLRGSGGARGEWDTFLAVAFPDNQTQILPYNRVIKDLGSQTPESLLAKLRETYSVRDGGPTPRAKGQIAMYLAGRWHTITLGPVPAGGGIAERLDVSRLQESVLSPMLDIGDVRTDKRIDFIGGGRGPSELERVVKSGKAAVAFSMYPVSISDLMEISDAGGIMPPKSTWFEPKLRDGLLSHVI